MKSKEIRNKRNGTSSPLVLLIILFSVAVSGCGLFESDNPGSILADDINDASTIPFLVNGQKNELALQLDVAVIYSGLLADELIHSGSYPTWREMSNGDVKEDNGDVGGIWAGLQRSRFLGDDNVPRMKELLGEAAASDVNVASALNYSGYAYLLFFFFFERAAYNTGPEVSRAGSFQLAIDRFTEAAAVASAGGHSTQLDLAYVGLARAQLMLGNYQAALATANQVTPGFEFFINYDAQNSNSVFFFNHRRAEYSIREPFWNTGDPRVVVEYTGGPGADNETPQYLQQKYNDDISPIRLASGMEAILIAAEAQNETGDQSGAIASINFVRQNAGLGNYEGANTYEAVRDAIRLERKYELFLEGKRLNDLRRYRDDGDAESVAFFQNRISDALPLPDSEYRTNPNVGPKGQ